MIHVARGCSAWRYPCCKSFTAKTAQVGCRDCLRNFRNGAWAFGIGYYEDILKKTTGICIYCPQIKVLYKRTLKIS